MGVSIPGEEIDKVLANCREVALRDYDRLIADPALEWWRKALEDLAEPSVPVTYMAVAVTLLTARALREQDEVDVLDLKVSAGPKGFSAQAVGFRLASFAKTHGIDVRATSSQPINNQPFTAKNRIHATMQVQAGREAAWQRFWSAAVSANGATSAQAREALALTFATRQRRAVSVREVTVEGGLATFQAVVDDVATFVDTHVEGGRVGQAFAGALLDLTYPIDGVEVGDVQDPDRSRPGDVHASLRENAVDEWVEVKQKVIATGEVTSFVAKVEKAGGERVIYMALRNESYGNNIRVEKVMKAAKAAGISLRMFQSPADAIEAMTEFAPGSPAHLAGQLLERMRARLVEAGCTKDLINEFDDLARTHGRLGSP